jgi:hypothetical protein
MSLSAVSASSLAQSSRLRISSSQGKTLKHLSEKNMQTDCGNRKLGDHTYLSWNNDEPSTATTTGRARPGEGA